MKVFEHRGFPNPARVRIALAEKGLLDAVEMVPVDVTAGEHREPAMLARNPSGAVPILELDDGTTISECSAITDYLDHLAGDPTLTGTTPRERGLIQMYQRKIEAGLLDAVSAYFHHATPGLGPKLETSQVPEWGLRQRDRATVTIRWMDTLLESRDYLAQDRFTVADITALGGLAFADHVGLEIPSDCQRLLAWRARVSARPSVAQL